jgi:outer membrane assembly lipoprotein YfiO
MKRRMFAILIPLVAFAPLATAQTRSYDLHSGQWIETRTPTTAPSTQPIANATLDRAEQLLSSPDFGAALPILLDWEKANKKAPDRDRCIYLFSNYFYQQDDYFKSFFYCDELMDEYPDSRLFAAALQHQYDIAHQCLNGYKKVFLGLRIVGTGDEGVEMMFRIQTRSPGSPLAEKALLETADYWFNTRQYDVATEAYHAYLTSYPKSPFMPRIRLRSAFASLAQFSGVKFDVTKLIDARAQLQDIQSKYPELAREENVADVIARIDAAFCQKLLVLGSFYERTHAPKAAVYEYRFLIQTYPKSPEAADARSRLAAMPPSVLDDPAPAFAASYAPSVETEPVQVHTN